MIDWLSTQKRREKRKAARDAILKEEISAKAKSFETEGKQVVEDFTELTINGLRRRVPVDRITILDVSQVTEQFV
jgi:hypothetical protein